MLRCVLLFAVSSGSVVNSVTVKAGSNTPKPNDPVVVRGRRSDGFLKMDRTPKKAEKTLGKEVAPNDDLFNTNDYQKYYGASPRVRVRVFKIRGLGTRVSWFRLGLGG